MQAEAGKAKLRDAGWGRQSRGTHEHGKALQAEVCICVFVFALALKPQGRFSTKLAARECKNLKLPLWPAVLLQQHAQTRVVRVLWNEHGC